MITWKIEKLITVSNDTQEDVVKNAEFQIKYEKDGRYAETRGNKDLTYNAESFTSYEEITEEQAVTWVKNVLGTTKVTKLENLVKDAYDNMKDDEIGVFVYTLDSLTATEKTLNDLPF
jgi:vacuolar-type H+-ATPase subunit E/Vma4